MSKAESDLRMKRALNDALARAAWAGDEATAIRLIARGAEDIERARAQAGSGGHWGLATAIVAADSFRAQRNKHLAAAAAAGDIELMRKARAFGATEYNLALKSAAHRGQLAAMEAARGWGAEDVDGALAAGAAGGRLRAMALAWAWGASDFDRAFVAAARQGQVAALDWLEAHGISNSALDTALWEAASEGHHAAMLRAYKYGATDFDTAMEAAAVFENVVAMRLIRSWAPAASRFAKAIGSAEVVGAAKARALLEDWAAQAEDSHGVGVGRGNCVRARAGSTDGSFDSAESDGPD